MGVSLITFGSVSGFWAIVAIIVPCFIPKGPNKRVTQWCLILTAICCWVFWVLCYITQMNPLVGPQLKKMNILNMAKEWGNTLRQG